MKKLVLAGLGLALIATLTPTARAAPDPAVVTTAQGAVRGVVDGDVRSFQGIPYATAERFAAPRAPDRWHGVRDATAPGKVCAQPAGYPIGRPSTDEDCLNVNVTTPVHGRGESPVIVWIHGGSMMFGMGDLYGPNRLAAGGAVVVSMNYRLGVTSFLTHPSLPESGALALDDQRAALQWVRRNIGAFGGDPHNVTIMGQSGGGYSVCGHLASPRSAGLFHRAIVQSAPCLVPGSASRTRAVAQAESDVVIREVGCAKQADVAACLRDVDMGVLLAKYGTENREPRPVSGTATLPVPVDEALRTGRFNRVPVLFGVNHDEETGMILGLELATGVPMSAEEYEPEIRRLFPGKADAVLARYPLGPSAGQTLATVLTDANWSAPTLDTARALSRFTPTRMYEFAEQDTPWYAGYPAPSFPAAAQHMAELPYLFDLDLFEPAQPGLSARMIATWTGFAKTGRTDWPTLRGGYVQSLTAGPWQRADFAADHRYRFWSQYCCG